MNKEITKSRIKSIGKKLRIFNNDELIDQEDLEYFNKWRDHHSSSLNYYAKLLREEAIKLNVDKENITITHRLKRFYSIILKLKRFPQMQLSFMDDIAGVRIVLFEVELIKDLFNILKQKKSKHKMIKVNNYISSPKDDGYRSIHLVYKIEKTPTIQIEVQLRSQLQHIWATGVEVFGTLKKTSFKTGEGEQDWKEFFKLLSSWFAIKENTPVVKEHEILSHSKLEKLLIKKIKDMNIVEQLTAYTSIYSSSWRDNRSKGRSGKYALLTLDNCKSTTEVEVFADKDLSIALEKYSSIEKNNHSSDNINVVLVNLNDLDNLEKAYPNYFMDTKVLNKYLSQIVLGEFIENL